MLQTDKTSATQNKTSLWFLLLLISYPLIIIFYGFSFKHGFLALPRIGENFIEKVMPQLKELNPPIHKHEGYDGQFYVQMAIDPTLRSPQLSDGIDDIGYRGQRIGLSAIAYALGLGQPKISVQIYCVLNFFSWCVLTWLVLRWVGTATLQQRCIVLVNVYTAGALVSISRALTDLPAATLGLLALWLTQQSGHSSRGQVFAWISYSASTLCKETGILSSASLLNVKAWKPFFKSCLLIGISLVPLILWTYYVKSYIGQGGTGGRNITPPLVGLFAKYQVAFSRAFAEFPSMHPVEILGPASILIQAVYILRRFDWRNDFWRFGFGFAVLPFFIAFDVWETQTAFSRVLLPLTLAFNLHLYSIRNTITSKSHRWWFWLGNLGLLDRGLPMLVIWIGLEYWLLRRQAKRLAVTSTV